MPTQTAAVRDLAAWTVWSPRFVKAPSTTARACGEETHLSRSSLMPTHPGGDVGRMRFMTEPIACPRCGQADLTSGVIVGRSPGVKFKRSKGLTGDLTGVPVTTGLFNH